MKRMEKIIYKQKKLISSKEKENRDNSKKILEENCFFPGSLT